MKRMVIPAVVVAAGFSSGLAFAGQGRHAGDNGRYYGTQEYADVVAVNPIYRTVRIEQPRRECWDERVVYRDSARDRGYWMDNGAAGSIVGAIAGGVAGHQFGKGRGKDAATVLGAVIGAGVGQRVAVTNSRPEPSYERVGYEERCETVTDYRTEQRVDGYDVTYRYGGRTYNTTMPHDPGARIPVNVDVQPAGGSFHRVRSY